ncbi:liprin-beta-2 isoform X4 [Phyllobates terribilis]|uniref:liprin-beta-2 isoform X4 n=1 Tax=Phyllobates terribilis TaxID=111132 RepID=UPI003CCACC30
MMASDASHMLEAALEQMDDIIAGTKAVTEFANGVFDVGSPVPSEYFGTITILHLIEELKISLEMVENPQEREALRNQIPNATASYVIAWLESNLVNHTVVNNETYQERLTRLEGDKESLILQVSVLTDQVEAQGDKIRDLETCVEEHHLKLNATEEMLQQELLSRTSLETQKLDLMAEISNLKIKLVGLEKEKNDCEDSHTKAESLVNLINELQEQMCKLQLEINTKIQEREIQARITDLIEPVRRDSPSCDPPQPGKCGDPPQPGKCGDPPQPGKCGDPPQPGKCGDLPQPGKCGDLPQPGKCGDLPQPGKCCDPPQPGKCCDPPQPGKCCDPPQPGKWCSGCEGKDMLLQELKNLKIRVEELENERTQYEWKLKATKAEIAQLQEQLALKDAEIERLQSQISSKTIAQNESSEREEVFKRRIKEKNQEVQRLKLGMETLLAANEEKDLRIEELTMLLNQYRRVKNFVMATHGSSERILSIGSEDEVESTIKKLIPKNNQTMELLKSEVSSNVSSPTAPTSPPQNILENGISTPAPPENVNSPQEENLEPRNRVQPRLLSSSLEDLQSGSMEKHADGEISEPVVTPESKADPRYQTLPGKLSRSTPNGSHDGYRKPASQNALHINSETNGMQSLCETENNLDITFNDLSSGGESGPHSPLSPEGKKSPKGIKKFWGKIRRTPSGNFHTDELGLSEFKRGGMRATAGPRLSRTKDPYNKNSDYNAPFAQWSNEQVCNWLEDFGLGQYVIFARQWVSSGHTLLTATPQTLEKELGIKHPLHRKKLQLAIGAISSKKEEKSGQLDHMWVTRWLDDIGLPQYKDQFQEARVDGRMLQYLTVNDLLFLKVTSQLHHLSIKCAIHVLHANKFQPNCLRRRPADENNISPSEVVQWSNHRVMEWLRSVDLAEYAPNLRGSGVHGGLIILEPRFNSDTLAMLLNIPTQKTLLRRHLATNFSLLIGPEAQQEKREIMDSTTYTALSTTAKVRPKKLGLSHFSNLRKKKFDDSTDFVCPVDASPQKSDFKTPNNSSIKDVDKLEQNMLSQDEILNNYRLLSSYDSWR